MRMIDGLMTEVFCPCPDCRFSYKVEFLPFFFFFFNPFLKENSFCIEVCI